MEIMPPQRVDIAQVVGEYEGKTPRQVRQELAEAPPPQVYPPSGERKAEPQKAPGSWYVVVDEIIEGRVTLEAWPWPTVNPQTKFLSFDLSQTKRMTLEAVDVHRMVSEHRAAVEPQATAARPLRIGDVFEVTSPKITDLGAWTSVEDHTKEKRAEVRAAVDAMATPPHSPDKAEELERMAREQQPTVGHGPGWTSAYSGV